MRKQILLAVAALTTVGASAQTVRQAAYRPQRTVIQAPRRIVNTKAEAPVMALRAQDGTAFNSESLAGTKLAGPHRADTVLVYYTRPEGTFYWGSTKDGRTYWVNQFIVPPSFDVTFNNQSTDPTTTTWTSNGQAVESDMVLANGDLHWGTTPGNHNGYVYYLPTLSNGTLSYILGQNNSNNGGQYGTQYMYVDSIGNIAPFDNRTAQGAGLGGLDNSYLFGTGTITFSDVTATSRGLIQLLAKPASPLYVEDIYLNVYSFSEAIKNDGQLTMRIVKCDIDADGNYNMTDSVIAEMTATTADTTLLTKFPGQNIPGYNDPQDVSVYNITFAKKGEDQFGEPYNEPFVINDPVAIIILGCDNANVDVDLLGRVENDQDALNTAAYTVYSYNDSVGETHTNYQPLYRQKVMLDYNLTGGFDRVEVFDTLAASIDSITGEVTSVYPNLNVVRVSNDGQTADNDGYTTGMGGAYVRTAFVYFDGDGNENYYPVEELPDWIQSLNVTSIDPEQNTYVVTPVCDALPEGTTGRSFRFHLQGKGFTSSNFIYVLQGDATYADGIEGVTIDNANRGAASADNRVFNLQGQRVSKNYRGVVIQGGKKRFQK